MRAAASPSAANAAYGSSLIAYRLSLHYLLAFDVEFHPPIVDVDYAFNVQYPVGAVIIPEQPSIGCDVIAKSHIHVMGRKVSYRLRFHSLAAFPVHVSPMSP
jgi:hypothetical protein